MFRKKTTPPPAKEQPLPSAASQFINRRLERVQDWLNGISPRGRIYLFIAMGLPFFTYCALLVFDPALTDANLPIERAAVPAVRQQLSAPIPDTEPDAEKNTLRHLVDSLRQDPAGSRLIDSLEQSLGADRPW